MQTTATYDSTAGTVSLTRGAWQITFPATDLPKWLSFYRFQQERFPDHASTYEDDVKALAVLAAQLRG
jgi:hypothetical protein